MQTQEPAEQGAVAPANGQGEQRPQAQQSEIEVGAPGEGPLITGPAPYLWVGFGAVAIVFLIVFWLVLASRARADMRRTARRKDRSAKAGAETQFFQPAGEDAEIIFDDEPLQPLPPSQPKPAHQGDLKAEEERAQAAAIIHKQVSARKDAPEPPPPGAGAAPARRKGPFAGIFARNAAGEAPPAETAPAESAEAQAPREEERAEMAAAAPMRAHPFASERREASAEAVSFLQPANDQRRQEETRAAEIEAARRRALDEAARARAEAEEERRLAEVERRAAEREIEFDRRKLAAAFEQRERALAEREASLEADMTALRDDLARELDERFSSLNAAVDSRLDERAPQEGAGATAEALASLAREIDERFDALTQYLENRLAAAPVLSAGAGFDASGESAGALADMLASRVADERREMNAALARLAERIDLLAGAHEDVKTLREEIGALKRALFERVSGPAAPSIQLSDIVRNALPPNAFELRALLPNNRRADCLVKLPHPPGPIAIDARFPVEAFARLHEAKGEETARAENEFRRTALRHIVDIAERLIVPEETAESALMFLPSESMYAELHARFPDVVQDSYRARVWIVSPTSLMATLHTIRAVLRDAQARESADLIHAEAQHVLAEVDGLRRRVIALEEDFNRTRHDVRDLLSSTDQVYRRAETISNTRRALNESALDRGSRTIPAAPPPPEAEASHAAPPAPPPAEEVQAGGDDGPDLWEDRHGEERGEQNGAGAPFPLR